MQFPQLIPSVASTGVILLSLSSAGLWAQGLVFDNVVVSTNTQNLSFGRGAAMVDLDRDGLLDLICADAGETNQFYHQRADGTFEDASVLWGVGIATEYDWGVLAADFDNDGDDDVYFANGGYAGDRYAGRDFPNRLLRNDIAQVGKLTDVTNQSGDAVNTKATFGATALDYDRDGFLDIFCADRNENCTLLRNVSGTSFDDVSLQAGIVKSADWRHPGAADYDNDGWVDVAVGNRLGLNALYRNQQDGTFVDVAVQAGVESALLNFGMVFQDFDNDGLQDIYIAKYQTQPSAPSPVMLNNGDGTFRDVSPGSGMSYHTDMGHNSGDLDADGYPEIMMGTGSPQFGDIDRLYRVVPDGAGGLRITDVTNGSRFGSGGSSRQHGQAMGDYDRDGDIDVYCNNGGPDNQSSTQQANFFWRNRGNSNAWTAFEMEGVLSNRTGVGLVAKATTNTGRDVYRTLQVGRGFSNTPDHALHFGIGSDTSIERVELRWPSGIVQLVDDPALSQYQTVTETGMLLRGVPKIGQSLTIDVAGRAGELVEIGFSMSTATTDLEGINGPLLLGSPFIMLPALPLDGGGRLTLPLPIPDLSALVGLSFYSQGWIHGVDGLGYLSQLHSFTIQ